MLQKIENYNIVSKGIELYILRLDIIHPKVCANKWYKLKYNLGEAKQQNKSTLLTFGGAFSNHIHAVATAGKLNGFKTIGVIRGERVEPLNYTLSYAEECGMQLHFVSREAYKSKDEIDFKKNLEDEFGEFYLIPEGGTNELAVKGAAEIINEIDMPFDYVCCPIGTGGTFAGIVNGLKGNEKAIGFSSLKGAFVDGMIKDLLAEFGKNNTSNYEIESRFHFGGYAKFNNALIDFINGFKREHKVPLEPIYTAKMMFGLNQLVEKERFKRGERVIAVHTGGLQGIEGFNKRFGNIIN